MKTKMNYTDTGLDLSPEMMAAHPELRVQFIDPPKETSPAYKLSSHFQGGLDASIVAPVPPALELPPIDRDLALGLVATMVEIAARQAIEFKARELGALPGTPISDVESAGTGFVRRYQGCDIYYSKQTGAHEVHGDIRAKYNAWRGAEGELRLPLTDEMGTPDGVGRFNHFEGGSIYWTPSTGPMIVRGAVRDLWAAQGWERSQLGYPVNDAHDKRITDPIHNPAESWGVFQNGAIFSLGNRAALALVAELPAPKLTQVVRDQLDIALHKKDNDLGIEGGGRILRVSDWGYGFWASRRRQVTFEIQGFYKLPVVPDPTFRLELTLEFDLVSELSFTEPLDKTLVAILRSLRVDTSGFGHGSLHDQLRDGILDKFKEPFPVRTIPANSLLMDILVTSGGALQFLLEPDIDNPVKGNLRRLFFQQSLDSL